VSRCRSRRGRHGSEVANRRIQFSNSQSHCRRPARPGDPVFQRRSCLFETSLEYWMPAGACHRAALRADPVAGMTRGGIRPHSRGALRVRVMHHPCPSRKQRAQGRPGARRTRGPVCKKLRESAHGCNHRQGGITPAFPAQCFYGLLRALPGEPACLPPSEATMRKHRRQLSACMGAPGPHDFAVRKSCRSSIGTFASTATRLAFRDDRDTPLCNRGGTRRI
jgi:hypothetical protein